MIFFFFFFSLQAGVLIRDMTYDPDFFFFFFFFFTLVQPPPPRFQIFFEFCCGGFFFTLRQCLIQGFRFQNRGVSCFCAQKFFSTAEQGHWEHRELYFFFCEAKKKIKQMAPQAKKNLGYSVKI